MEIEVRNNDSTCCSHMTTTGQSANRNPMRSYCPFISGKKPKEREPGNILKVMQLVHGRGGISRTRGSRKKE